MIIVETFTSYIYPTNFPTYGFYSPTPLPSTKPTATTTTIPTVKPTGIPTFLRTKTPTSFPSVSSIPSVSSTNNPNLPPILLPTSIPSFNYVSIPTAIPSVSLNIDCTSSCTVLSQGTSVSKGKLSLNNLLQISSSSLRISFEYVVPLNTANSNFNIFELVSANTGASMLSIGFQTAGIIYQTYVKYNGQNVVQYGPFATANKISVFTLDLNFVTGQYTFTISGCSWIFSNIIKSVLNVNPNGLYKLYTSNTVEASPGGVISSVTSKMKITIH